MSFPRKVKRTKPSIKIQKMIQDDEYMAKFSKRKLVRSYITEFCREDVRISESFYDKLDRLISIMLDTAIEDLNRKGNKTLTNKELDTVTWF